VNIINPMKRALAISVIALVAVIMGMSAVAPMIPPAFAHDVPPGAFETVHKICDNDVLPPDVRAIICNHDDTCPPNCGGGFSVEPKTF